MSKDTAERDSIFRIGRVVSVDGRSVTVIVDKAKNSSHLLFKGDLVKNVSVGSYIKIVKGFTKIICKVEGEFTNEDIKFSGKRYSNDKDKISRSLKVSLLGFFKKNGEFERGIKEMPLIDNECYILDRDEFNDVHHFLGKDDKGLAIGKLSLEKGQDIEVGINSLFASHIGIFGNTGSGKSYTLAKIYYELFKKYKENPKFQSNARFFLLDFNGEYVDDNDNIIVEKDYKNIYKLSTKEGSKKGDSKKFPVKRETLYEPSFWSVVLEATEKTQTPFLRRAITNNWLADKIKSTDSLKDLIKSRFMLAIDRKDKELGSKILVEFLSEIDGCIPGSNIAEINDILRERIQYYNKDNEFIYIVGGKWHFGDTMKELIVQDIERITLPNNVQNDLDILKLQIVFQYYDDILKGFSNREHLAPLIKRMEKRFEDIRKVIEIQTEEFVPKNFTIVSLKHVNIHMRKILPLLLCKQLYDQQKSMSGDEEYLNIIIDEAHNILSRESERESKEWKDYRLETFEEIIKEGRKFGVFLTLASQRPSDISPTIVSQIHNYFLHRLINNNDISAVEKTISYLDKISFESLPILPTGTCILAGLSAQVPVVVDIGHIEKKYEPNNKTVKLLDHWD